MSTRTITIDWESRESITHKLTVSGAYAYRENYGEDADGNRGMMMDFVEYDNVVFDPTLKPSEQSEFDKFDIYGAIAHELAEIDAAARDEAAEYKLDRMRDEGIR
jgi:hypothetical protein